MTQNTRRPFAVTQTLGDRLFGGIERYVVNLSEELRERGTEVSFILSEQSPVLGCLIERGFPCTTISIRGDLDLYVSWQVASALRRYQPDLVNIHDSAAIVPFCLGARLAGTRMLVTVHAFHQKWGFLFTDHMVTVSEALRRHMLAQGFHDDRVTTVRSGVNLRSFPPGNRRYAQQTLGLAGEHFYFAAVCRLARHKGLPMLLEVFADIVRQAPHARLLLAGSGPLEGELRAQVARARLHPFVRFLGFQQDVRPVLLASHCIVLPSDREGLGLVLLEAMASARAVIATASGGPAEVVHHEETGLLIPPRDPHALRQAMLRVAYTPHWADTAGQRARQIAEQEYTFEQQVDGLKMLYHQLTGFHQQLPDEEAATTAMPSR